MVLAIPGFVDKDFTVTTSLPEGSEAKPYAVIVKNLYP